MKLVVDKGRLYRKFNVLTSTVLCALGAFLFAQASSVKADDYESYSGESIVDEFVVETPDGPYKQTVEIFPKEIYYGDPVYIVSYAENISDKTIDPYIATYHMPMCEVIRKAEASSKEFEHTYVFQSERPKEWTDVYFKRLSHLDLEPKEKLIDSVKCLEFPPLEDWEHVFWQELRGKMTSEGIVCAIDFSVPYYDGKKMNERKISHDVLIKPRPNAEQELLDKWYNETPKECFPIQFRSYPDVVQRKAGEPREECKIRIGDLSYDPDLFIRTGNRKPAEPNNPTTLEGWKELEASLAPSVMRDEIHFTRLLLEYYSSDAENSEVVKTAIVDWLNSLPRAQRSVFSPQIPAHKPLLDAKPLRLKTKKLMRAINLSEMGKEF